MVGPWESVKFLHIKQSARTVLQRKGYEYNHCHKTPRILTFMYILKVNPQQKNGRFP
jgi:hypothetical protein